MFRGALTALVTPFYQGGIDENAFRSHIANQIEQGIDGLVPCGTTGESATMSHDEHRKIIEIAIEEARGKVPVIAGTGSNNTAEAVELTKFAKQAGASAALVITPYYNKPTIEGMLSHYRAIATEAKIPIVAYNVPSRTGVSLAPQTVARLAEIDGIVGIKEATASLNQVTDIIAACPDDFCVLSGDDSTVLPLLSVGGRGVISVVSNIAPADMAGLVKAYEDGDMAEAKRLHYKLLPLIRALFIETNPIPIKTAMARIGQIAPEVRLPLCRMDEANRDILVSALNDYGLIKDEQK